MPILLENFPEYIRKQLTIRQDLVGMTNGSNGSGGRFRDFNSSEFGTWPKADSNINITSNKGAFFSYVANKQCVIRMSSGVDVTNKNILESWEQASFGTGKKLAEHWILEGGHPYRKLGTEGEESKGTTHRKGVTQSTIGAGKAYGDVTARANAQDTYGIVPMAGIIDLNIRTRTAYGSLRDAKVHFKCHNRRQLEVLELLYMRPGYPVLIEWGWNPYISNKGAIESTPSFVTKEIFKTGATYEGVEKAIRNNRKSTGGNYDGLIGYVKNYNYKVRDDGGYDCFVEIVSANEVIESLKTPKTPKHLSATFTTHTDIMDPDDMSIQDYEDDLLLLFKSLNNYNKYEEIERQESGSAEIYKDDGVLKTTYPDQVTLSTYEYNRRLRWQQDQNEKYKAARQQLKDLECPYGVDWIMTKTPRLFAYTLRERKENRKAFNLWQSIKNTVNPMHSGPNIVFDSYEYEVDDQLTKFSFIKLDALFKYVNHYIVPKTQVNENSKFLAFQTNRIIRENTLNGSIKDTPAIVSNHWATINLDKVTLDALDGYAYGDVTGDEETQDRYVDELNFSINAGVCVTPNQMRKHFGHELKLYDTNNYGVEMFRRPVPLWDGFSGELKGLNGTITQNDALFKKHFHWEADSDFDQKIGNLWINTVFLQSLYEGKVKQFLDKGETPEINIGDFIADVLGNIKNSFGGLRDFAIHTNNEFSNVVEAVENTYSPSDLGGKYKPDPNKEFTLEILGTKSICKSFEYFSQIPNSLSSTIAVLAQNPDNIENLEDATFKAFNQDIRNRLIETQVAPTKILTTAEKTAFQSRVKKFISSLATLKNHISYDMWTQTFREYPTNSNNSAEVAKASQIMSSAQSELQYFKQVDWASLLNFNILKLKGVEEESSMAALVPLKFTAQIDGIGGITKNTLFRLPKNRLPKAYQNADIKFVVHNEEQQITNGQDWVTTIGGQMIFDPTQKQTAASAENIELLETELELIKEEVERKNNEVRELSYRITKNSNKILSYPKHNWRYRSTLNNLLNHKNMYYNYAYYWASFVLEQEIEIGPVYREEYDDMITVFDQLTSLRSTYFIDVGADAYPPRERPTFTSEGFVRWKIYTIGHVRVSEGKFGSPNRNPDLNGAGSYGNSKWANIIDNHDYKAAIKEGFNSILNDHNNSCKCVTDISNVSLLDLKFKGPLQLLPTVALNLGTTNSGGDNAGDEFQPIWDARAGKHGITNSVGGVIDFEAARLRATLLHPGEHGWAYNGGNSARKSEHKGVFDGVSQLLNENTGIFIKQLNTEAVLEDNRSDRAILIGTGMDQHFIGWDAWQNWRAMDNYIYEGFTQNWDDIDDPALIKTGKTFDIWEASSNSHPYTIGPSNPGFNQYQEQINAMKTHHEPFANSFIDTTKNNKYAWKQVARYSIENVKF